MFSVVTPIVPFVAICFIILIFIYMEMSSHTSKETSFETSSLLSFEEIAEIM